MDRSRRTRNEFPSRQEETEEAAVSESTHPRRGNISTSAATGTRPPTFSDNGNNYYSSERSRPHPSSHGPTQPTSRIPMPRGRVHASTIGDPPVIEPSYRRPHREDYNENSTASLQRPGRASAYAPPSVISSDVDDRRSSRALPVDARADHRGLPEMILNLAIRADPPASALNRLSGSNVPANSTFADRWRSEYSEQRPRPPPKPPLGPPTGHERRTRDEGSSINRGPKDLSGKIVLFGNAYFASGGFSSVWEGRWTHPDHGPRGQRLALKAFHGSRLPSTSEKFKARVWRETVNWHELHHPNILPLLGVCNSHLDGIPDFPLLVSEYCEGGSVNEYLRTHPHAHRGAIVIQISNGVKYLHEGNFVHCDLKGNNILIKGNGQVCIGDFGRTKLSGDEDYSKTITGSAFWLAPELLAHSNNDEPPPFTFMSDMWALGMVVIEVYTGDRPWAGKPYFVVLQEVMSRAIPRHSDYDNIPFSVWSVIAPCWRHKPHERPTIRDFRTNFISQEDPAGASTFAAF